MNHNKTKIWFITMSIMADDPTPPNGGRNTLVPICHPLGGGDASDMIDIGF